MTICQEYTDRGAHMRAGTMASVAKTMALSLAARRRITELSVVVTSKKLRDLNRSRRPSFLGLMRSNERSRTQDRRIREDPQAGDWCRSQDPRQKQCCGGEGGKGGGAPFQPRSFRPRRGAGATVAAVGNANGGRTWGAAGACYLRGVIGRGAGQRGGLIEREIEDRISTTGAVKMGLRVQSATCPSFSEREKGAKGMLAGWVAPSSPFEQRSGAAGHPTGPAVCV
ncbi:hypothetical protein Cni_G21814 [Canna indica]|uniref:Uncharacterized protein n=1 Tax=Canna indica TaxID=4628 RepID=A0AAQ3KQU5_9LILI|nr:hypothetical protein Cni_G21814 [Canna indica]